jgi:hypothetical protein
MDKLIKLSILNLIITVSFYLAVGSTGSKSYLLIFITSFFFTLAILTWSDRPGGER